MKIAIVGATGSIGSRVFEHILRRDDVESVVAISRKPLSSSSSSTTTTSTSSKTSTDRVRNVIVTDFGDLDSVSEEAWSLVRDADALIWAMGTYDLNEDVNFTYPLEFQRHLALQQENSRVHENRKKKFRFILLGGAFTETDQSRWLYFLPDQRRMKGLLQTRTLEFAESHGWVAHVIRPGGVLMGNDTFATKVAEMLFRNNLVIKSDELGACAADLAVNGSERNVIENLELVQIGRRLNAGGL